MLTLTAKNDQMTEEFKMQALKEKIARAEEDLRNGDFVDGEVFMRELRDGKYDECHDI